MQPSFHLTFLTSPPSGFFVWLFSVSPLPLHLLYSTTSASENLQLSPGLFCSPLISKRVSLVMALFITFSPLQPTTPVSLLPFLSSLPFLLVHLFSSHFKPFLPSFFSSSFLCSFLFSFYTKDFLDPKLSFLTLLLALKSILLLLSSLCKDTKMDDTYFSSLCSFSCTLLGLFALD